MGGSRSGVSGAAILLNHSTKCCTTDVLIHVNALIYVALHKLYIALHKLDIALIFQYATVHKQYIALMHRYTALHNGGEEIESKLNKLYIALHKLYITLIVWR